MEIDEELTLPNKEVFNDGIDILWALVAPCNLRCDYCYFGDPNNHFTWTTNSAVFKKHVFRFVDMLANTGVRRVFIAGGEPTQAKFLPDLISNLSENGIDTAISTNGILMDKKLTIDLAKSGINAIFFSIDSPTPQYHDRHRGQWVKSVKGLQTVVKLRREHNYSYKIGIYMVVSRGNIHLIPSMVKFVSEQGADYLEYQPVSLTEDHRLYDSLDFSAKEETRHRFLVQTQIARGMNRKLTLPSDLYQHVLEMVLSHQNIKVTNCFGGRSLFFIDPLGDIWPCPSRHRKTPKDNLGNIIKITEEGLRTLFSTQVGNGRGEPCAMCDKDCVCMFELTTSSIWLK